MYAQEDCKNVLSRASDLVNIFNTAPMEVFCIDFICLEHSKGGLENILVLTDQYRRTWNETAQTTTKALDFFVLTAIKKLSTVRYHSMGNDMSERFNRLPPKLFGTLEASQKTDWMPRVSTTTHAAVIDSTGFHYFSHVWASSSFGSSCLPWNTPRTLSPPGPQ